jgi:hypothetical protein
MAGKPVTEFGKRRPVAVQPAAPAKRSSHVALLLAGTVAVGGGAYALMPGENCARTSRAWRRPPMPDVRRAGLHRAAATAIGADRHRAPASTVAIPRRAEAERARLRPKPVPAA